MTDTIRNDSTEPFPDDAARGGLPAATLLPFALPIALSMAGIWTDPGLSWGFNYWALISPALALPLLLAALAITAVVGKPGVRLAVSRAVDQITTGWPSLPRTMGIGIGALLLCPGLLLLRSKAYVYGDSYSVLEMACRSSNWSLEGQMYLQSLSAFLFHYTVPWLRDSLSLSGETAFALLNCLGGTLGVYAIWRTAGVVTHRTGERLALFVTSLVSGSTLLFFGAVEHYTWPTVLGLWSMYFTLRYQRDGVRLWAALGCALLAAAFHFIALPFLAAVILTVAVKRIHWLSFRRGLVITALGAAAGVVACHLFSPFYWFTPPWPVGDRPIWVFSARHLSDVLNQFLLVAPLVPGAIVLGLAVRPEGSRRGHSSDLIGTVSLFAGLNFLAAFWVDPTIGAARDWDLLSLYGLPATVWAALVIIRRVKGVQRSALLLPALVAVVVHLGPNLLEKRDLRKAATRLDAILYDCPQHQVEYDQARRAMVWGVILSERVGCPSLAEKHFHRRLEGDSTCTAAWSNLGEMARSAGRWNEAEACYCRAATCDPANPFYLYRLAESNEHLGRIDSATNCALRSVRLRPQEAPIQTLTGALLVRRHDFQRGRQHLLIAHRLDPSLVQPITNLALLCSQTGQHDSACAYFAKAIRLSPSRPEYYDGFIASSLAQGLCRQAEAATTKLAEIDPHHPGLPEHRERIAACRSAQTGDAP